MQQHPPPIQIKMVFSKLNYKKGPNNAILRDLPNRITSENVDFNFSQNNMLYDKQIFNMFNIMTNTTSCGSCSGYK